MKKKLELYNATEGASFWRKVGLRNSTTNAKVAPKKMFIHNDIFTFEI